MLLQPQDSPCMSGCPCMHVFGVSCPGQGMVSNKVRISEISAKAWYFIDFSRHFRKFDRYIDQLIQTPLNGVVVRGVRTLPKTAGFQPSIH